jgi:hypothetical protein
MKKLIRNAHIGIAVAIAILVVGFWPTHTSEDAVAALGMVAFFTGLGVCFGISYREERAREKRSGRES